MASRREHIIGSMVGLAVGDALGFPAEFRSRKKIQSAFGPKGITDFVALHDPRFPRPPHIFGKQHPPGTFSDDTQMAIAIAEALLAAPRRDLEALMREMSRRFVAWSISADNDRAPGSTCMTGCENLSRGVHWRDAGVRESKGCGSVMRVAPVGLVLGNDRDWMLEVARASSLPTHGHDAAVEGCAATALALALALEGATSDQVLSEIERTCGGRSADLDASLVRLRELRDAEPEVALTEGHLGEGWVAEEALVSALYCFLRAPDDFDAAVLLATNTDGDSDSIACIAGALSGARLGVEAIPRRWREQVEKSAELHALGSRLADAVPS
jgi:ADP-ribosylglycohydrolase